MADNLLTRTYQTKDICKATGINNGRLQNYFARGLIMGNRHIEGGGNINRAYRWSTVMEIALAGAFIEANLPPKYAFASAAVFSHTGHGDGEDLPPRIPGLPFHHDHDDTFVLAAEDTAKIACDKIHGYSRDLVLSRMGKPLSHHVVNVTQLLGEVCGRIDPDIDYRVFLDEAYGAK